QRPLLRPGKSSGGHPDAGPGQRRRQVAPEAIGGIVVFVEREPADRSRPPAACPPLGEGDGLASPRRTGNHGYRALLHALFYVPVNSRTRDDPTLRFRWRQLCHQERLRDIRGGCSVITGG